MTAVAVALAILGGLTAGHLVALFGDALYTGAPLERPEVCGRRAAGADFLPYWRCAVRREGCSLPSRWYLLPALTAAWWGAAAARTSAPDGPAHFVLLAWAGTILLALSTTDLERHRIPNRVVYPAIAAGIALSWAWPDRGWANTLLAGVLGLALLLVPALVVPSGLGLGDVKLSALIGLLCGLKSLVVALTTGVVAGAVGALVVLIVRRDRKALMPYGPFLAAGALFALLWGARLYDWYVGGR